MVNNITLKNGVRVVYEQVPSLRSCSLGIWVESGSRHEPEELSGISHFIEHMMFKGTDKMNAAQLAEAFDAIGGGVNAFTTKENTCYYLKTLDEYLDKGAETLCHMYFDSVFTKENVDLERGVIVEEIGMYEDTPEDVANELLAMNMYGTCSLGRPILGTRESLAGIDEKILMDYYKKNYTPKNTIVSLAGSFSEESLQKIIARFENMPEGNPPVMPEAVYTPVFVNKERDIEQNHIYIAFPALAQGDDRRFTAAVLNNILGGGMSSRLFQTVREQNGLCYTVYSFVSASVGTGVLGIYTATNKNTEHKAVQLICDVCRDVCENGVTPEELDRSKSQLKAAALMSLENTATRMTNNAKNHMVYGREITPEEIAAGYEAVTLEDVKELANLIFDFDKMSLAAVGKISPIEEYKKSAKVL